MKLFYACAATLLFLSAPLLADSMQCRIGPVHKVFGSETWIVYACSDDESIVAVTSADNPANPFMFFIGRLKDGSFGVAGEGNGDKATSKAAFDDLAKLQKSDIDKIIIEAKEI